MMRSTLSSLLFPILAAGSAVAQDVKPAPTPVPAAVSAPASPILMERCLSSGPHFGKTIAAAKAEGWTPLAADMAMAFTPISDPIAIEGWLIGDGDTRRFEALVGFRAKVGEKPVEGCTTAVGGVDAQGFEKQIVTAAAARPVGQDEARDTLYKRYTAKIDGRDVALTISLPRYPNGSDQVLVTLVAEESVEN